MKPTRPTATRSTIRRRRSNATGSNAGKSTTAHGREPRSAGPWIGGRPACHGGTGYSGLDVARAPGIAAGTMPDADAGEPTAKAGALGVASAPGAGTGCAPMAGLSDTVGSLDAPGTGCVPVTGANGTLGVACQPGPRGDSTPGTACRALRGGPSRNVGASSADPPGDSPPFTVGPSRSSGGRYFLSANA